MYPKKHVKRYKSAMTQYIHNDALLCLNFPQTLGDLGSQWFGRIVRAFLLLYLHQILNINLYTLYQESFGYPSGKDTCIPTNQSRFGGYFSNFLGFGPYLGFGGVSVIFQVQRASWSFFRLRVYFSHFLGLWGIFWSFFLQPCFFFFFLITFYVVVI